MVNAVVMQHSNETALITGASSGLGLELAKLMAGDDTDLILVARSEDKLEQLKAKLENRFSYFCRCDHQRPLSFGCGA